MSYESSLVNYSIDKSFFEGFIWGDPLRPFTSTSYHIGTIFMQHLNLAQNYLGMQVLYFVVLTFRSIFLYLLVSRLTKSTSFGFLAAVILLSYSADGATLWVGQLNQVFSSTILLLAFIYLEKIQSPKSFLFNIKYLTLSLFCLFFALLSYETYIIGAGLLVFFLIWNKNRFYDKLSKYLIIPYFIMFSMYISLFLYPGLFLSNDPYKKSQSNFEMNIFDSISLSANYFSHGLDFLNWLTSFRNIPVSLIVYSFSISLFIALLCIKILDLDINPNFKVFSSHFVFLSIVAYSFMIPFVFLSGGFSTWRTYLISSISFSLIIALFLFSLKSSILLNRFSLFFLILLYLFFSISNSLERGLAHKKVWAAHADELRKIKVLAPCLVENAQLIIILPDVYDTFGGNLRDPFGHNMWLNESLKLLYPHKNISAYYFSELGKKGNGVEIDNLSAKDLLVLSLENRPKIQYSLSGLRAFQQIGFNALDSYDPSSVIKSVCPKSSIGHKIFR
jgi:hypothetical protein